ncbi:MAG: zf-HC2 domain-containing protein, partial [Planctomycetota bacterium]
MRTFSCDEARAHLSDALLAEIGRPEANVLEAHLLDCDPCRSLSELFIWQDRVITELAAQARLDTLMSKIREGIENKAQVTFEEELQQRRRQWSWTFPTRGVAAAAAFILALIAVLYWRPTIPDPVALLTPTPPS